MWPKAFRISKNGTEKLKIKFSAGEREGLMEQILKSCIKFIFNEENSSPFPDRGIECLT